MLKNKIENGANGAPVTVVAHDGPFHSDDVFAVAALELLLGGGVVSAELAPASAAAQVIRSRDEKEVEAADYVVDVGGQYDVSRNRFDHHQAGGAGERANGVPFASFGLVWRQYGEKISGSEAVAEAVDQRLVQPIDAIDNGVPVWKEVTPGLRPFDISSMIGAMNPNWNEDAGATDMIFLQAVELAKNIITREVLAARSDALGESFAIEAYQTSADKRLIVLDREYPWEKVYSKFPEPLFVIYPKENNWRIKAVRNSINSFENRKDLPAAWAGKKGAELSAVTGIPGGIFCHNKLFTAGAETKDAAVAMGRVAVDN